MNNKEYVDAVNENKYPETIKVPLDEPFKDDRGVIQNIWLGNSGSVTYISSKKGAIRARHIHTNDFHGCFMISGAVVYTEKNEVGEIIHQQTYCANEMFFTRPDVWHEMFFIQDSQMVTMNGIVKSHVNYEASIERKEF